MQRKIRNQAKSYVRQNNRRRVWKKLVQIMSGAVIFCTTYALILPAITMERSALCQMEEHTHSDSCYQQLVSR